ncbi:MAG: hypothetical protein LBU66_03100, partial [Treponema sp.]|nr:hypothetical protein [Treponema sp.]
FLPYENGNNKSAQTYRETAQLRFYRNKLEEKTAMMDAQVIAAQGLGVPLNISKKEDLSKNRNSGANREQSFTSTGKPAVNYREFLEQYRNDIERLPVTSSLSSLSGKERQILTTLLPYAAAIKKRNMELKTGDVLREVKKYCVEEIDKFLA